jgi:hypothetical protein
MLVLSTGYHGVGSDHAVSPDVASADIGARAEDRIVADADIRRRKSG